MCWQEEESLKRFYETRCAAVCNSVDPATTSAAAAAAAASDTSVQLVADEDEVTYL